MNPSAENPNSFRSFYSQNQKIFWLLIALLVGFFFLFPFTDYQPFLAQGDHGRDLYAFEKTIDGAKVYRDYWWVYGPLMPYYYAGFELWLGKTIQTVLFGEMLLTLASGILIYLIISLFFPFSFGFFGALWFWVTTSDIFTAFNHTQSPILTHFFFTYNHTGGVTMLLLSLYALCLYLQNPRIKYLWIGLLALFLCSLIKVNFGLSGLLAFVLSVILIDFVFKNPFAPKKIFILGVILMPGVLFLIYQWNLQGLTVNEIRQCLPYLKGDQPYEASIRISLSIYKEFIYENLKSAWPNLLLCVLFVACLMMTAYRMILERLAIFQFKKLLLLILILLLFVVVNLHEFLFSGVQYRAFWAKPFQVLILLTFIGIYVYRLPKFFRYLILGSVVILILWEARFQLNLIKLAKDPTHYLSLPKTKIYVGNDALWIDTVARTTEFLQTHLKPGEKFFALPYDVLYYYLTDRTSPTRQLIFFDHIKIPTEQEERIIQELENQKIDWVLLSSRHISQEQGLGILGVTYCPLLGKYLQSNFQPVQQFGDWQNQPGWAWNHGALILRRRSTF